MKLLSIKGFFPYIMLVFLNTFVDLGHKILIQDTLYQTVSGSSYTVLSSIINALILIPYILIFTPSGFIADKFSKASVLKVTAYAAIPLTVLVTLCYFKGYFWGAFSLTLLLAIQSALNSPAKYGYIKELVGKEHLSQANELVQTLAIIAILGATFAFTCIFSYYMQKHSLQQSHDKTLLLQAFAPAGFLLIICSVFETIMTYRLVSHPAADEKSQYHLADYFKGRHLKNYVHKTFQNQIIFTCIIGLSLFWSINQVLLASYGAFLKDYIGNVSVVFAQGSLAMGGIGILLGALYAGKVSKGFVETGLIPVAAIGIAVGLFLLPHLTNSLAIVGLFLGYGFFGGMLIVPLNALIQFNAPRQEAGKVQSTNNFFQNCFMISFLILTVVLGVIGINSKALLYGLCIIAFAGAVFTLITLPQSLVRYGLYCVASRFYHLNVYQLDNLPSTGGVLLLGNHISFIDWAIVQIASPRPIRFVVERSYTQIWYLKWLFKQFKVIPIAKGASSEALIEINNALNAGEVVALFPEGRLSINGQMGTFRTGFERAALDAKAVIIPFYIHGLWGSRTSYAANITQQPSRRSVCVVYGAAMDIQSTAQQVKEQVKQLSIKAWIYSVQEKKNLQTQWLLKAKRDMRSTAIIEESGKKISAEKLLGSVLFLQNRIKSRLKNQQNIGIILPSSVGAVIANLSVLFLGKTLVNLNYTGDVRVLESAKKQAEIKTILSSRLFLKKLKARGITIPSSDVEIIYLEDLLNRKNMRQILIYSILAKMLPAGLIRLLFSKKTDVNSTATIFFTSGSEDTPIGVKLSHANILSNIDQVSSVTGIMDNDVMLNNLPLFHAFGLTVTTFLPLLKGIPMLCCPDPTKVSEIAKLIFKHKVTINCSTSSLLGLYVRNAMIHSQMLASLRLVIAGAEKLSPEVYQHFKDKFNLEIYEGYGATEVAPVASCNLPDAISPIDWHVHKANKPGSVGLPLPGCAFRIVDPVTLEELPNGKDGLILIGGTQVMQGYLNLPEKTKEVLIQDGDFCWYKTGDKGHLDQNGFLTITDRYSRFEKIAREMIRLSQVEQEWQSVHGESIEIMAVALPNQKKEEQLTLV